MKKYLPTFIVALLLILERAPDASGIIGHGIFLLESLEQTILSFFVKVSTGNWAFDYCYFMLGGCHPSYLGWLVSSFIIFVVVFGLNYGIVKLNNKIVKKVNQTTP